MAAIIDGLLPSWLMGAACKDADPHLFFPHTGENREAASAKAICHQCPVEADCLDWALKTDEQFGIWGGKSQRERARIKRRV